MWNDHVGREIDDLCIQLDILGDPIVYDQVPSFDRFDNTGRVPADTIAPKVTHLANFVPWHALVMLFTALFCAFRVNFQLFWLSGTIHQVRVHDELEEELIEVSLYVDTLVCSIVVITHEHKVRVYLESSILSQD
mgnify:CR=1 FL=1